MTLDYLPAGNFAAIDFGISNTDIVTYVNGELTHWSQPYQGDPSPVMVRDLLAGRGVILSALRGLAVTGGRHRILPPQIDGVDVVGVGELDAIGRGGLALAQMDGVAAGTPVLVVSAGSGTAMVAARDHAFAHVTGTGVGGGTLLGLGRLLLQTVDPVTIDQLAMDGNPNSADLALADVVSGPIGALPPDATAVNFGRLGRQALDVSRADLAASLVTLVGQVITTLAISAARAQQIDYVIVTGHMTDMASMRRTIRSVGEFYSFPVHLPEPAGHGTALGAMLTASGD